MDDREVLVLFPAWIRDLFLVQSLQTGSEVHRTSHSVSTGSRFTGWSGWYIELTSEFHTIPRIRLSGAMLLNHSGLHDFNRDNFLSYSTLCYKSIYLQKTVVVTLTYKKQKIKESYTNRGNRRNDLYCNFFRRQEITKFYRLL